MSPAPPPALLAPLEELEAALLELEAGAGPAAAAGQAAERLEVFRQSALQAGLAEMEPPAQSLAVLLGLAGQGRLELSPELMDLLLSQVDFLRRLLFLLLPPEGAALDQAPGPAAAAPPALPPDAPSPAQEAAGAGPKVLKVEASRLDALVGLIGELAISYSIGARHEALEQEANQGLAESLRETGEIIDRLERQVAAIRRVPLRGLFLRMQRVAASLAAGLGKVVEVGFSGADTELDKDLVEELADPLVHLIRNALDHGLESPAQRHAAGKSPQGRLRLSASRQEDVVQVEVSDDGRGLDRERILAKAAEQGLVQPEREYGDLEVHRLILQPGFSTAAAVSELSGRGVGLDVAASALARLGGELDIASRPGRGTSFILRLPPHRAAADGITDGVVVEVGPETYVIPSLHVLELISPRPEDLAGLGGDSELLNLRGSHRPLLRLARVLEVEAPPRPAAQSVVVMVEAGGRLVGLVADSFRGQQQVVVRGLEPRAFPGVRVVKGCAILGEGLAMVLDVEAVAAAGGCLRAAA